VSGERRCSDEEIDVIGSRRFGASPSLADGLDNEAWRFVLARRRLPHKPALNHDAALFT
jgi:hypothetical protein